MKMLYLAGGSPATVFALAPLATAARNAGHAVIVAATADMVPVAAGVGLPAVPVTDGTMRDFMFASRDGAPLALPDDAGERLRFGGHGFGRLAAASMPALTELARQWRPDVVVGGTLAFAAGLLARRLGVPYVRHAWDMGEPAEMDHGAADELTAELAGLGLADLPEPELWIHLCPPSVLAPDAPDGRLMRYVPAGGQRRLEPWMYTRPERPRVCLTAGSRAGEQEVAALGGLVDELAAADVELVVAAPDQVAASLTAGRPGLRAGWLPLDTVLPTCDLLVHSGGGQTALTAMWAGVPQVLVPNMPKLIPHSRRLHASGAAVMLPLGEDAPRVVAVCREVLTDPAYRRRSGGLAAEIAALPGPAEILPVVTDLRVG
ncbi:nucleotide disphospho-sugar-binding domain-containing protein [Micromonospora sp. NPDC002296]|uniref:nucleotide disphospho-sugar-binding domain-containing protein n=1 Tax=Micromonospora sp. NPDC002296 TaxID=3154271 RepID=UPI00332FF81A